MAGGIVVASVFVLLIAWGIWLSKDESRKLASRLATGLDGRARVVEVISGVHFEKQHYTSVTLKLEVVSKTGDALERTVAWEVRDIHVPELHDNDAWIPVKIDTVDVRMIHPKVEWARSKWVDLARG